MYLTLALSSLSTWNHAIDPPKISAPASSMSRKKRPHAEEKCPSCHRREVHTRRCKSAAAGAAVYQERIGNGQGWTFDELKDFSQMDGVDDLAQRITATFRRTLRIASKWLRANFKYILQDQEFASFQQTEKDKGSESNKKTTNKISGHSTRTTILGDILNFHWLLHWGFLRMNYPLYLLRWRKTLK